MKSQVSEANELIPKWKFLSFHFLSHSYSYSTKILKDGVINMQIFELPTHGLLLWNRLRPSLKIGFQPLQYREIQPVLEKKLP